MILAANSSGGSSYTTLFLIVAMIAVFYFLMIRPQQRRRREIEAMQRGIGPGDQIVTVAGLYGTVVEIDDDTVVLEVSPGVTNRYARGAISKVVTPAARPADPDGSTSDKIIE